MPWDPNNPNQHPGEGSNSSSYEEYIRQAKGFAMNGGNSQRDAAKAVFEGPVGWYDLATGKHTLGGIEGYDASNMLMNKDVYDSLTPDEWASFRMMSQADQQRFMDNRMNDLIRTGKARKDQAGTDQAQADNEAKYAAWREQAMQRLDKFSQDMGKPLDQLLKEGDLGAKAATTTGANQAATAAYGRGIGGGGLSTANTQRSFLDAGMGYQLQRQQMGAQATQGLIQGLQTQYMNTEDRRRYEQGMNLQLQQAQAGAQNQLYQQNSQQAGGTLGLIGAGVGAYFGGAAGAQAGYSLGSGLGSQQYQTDHPYQPYQYKYPSGNGGGLGGGNNRFGGSQ